MRHDMTQALNSESIATLRQLGAATVYEAQGAKGALDNGMKPIDPTVRLAGPALTVDCRPADNLILHYAVQKAKPGDVLVVDAKGFMEAGPWGDVLTIQARAGHGDIRSTAGYITVDLDKDREAATKASASLICLRPISYAARRHG